MPDAVRQEARAAHAQFLQNPGHTSLCFKQFAGTANLWSVLVNEQYRVVGIRQGDTIDWIWIGTHNAFDKMF